MCMCLRNIQHTTSNSQELKAQNGSLKWTGRKWSFYRWVTVIAIGYGHDKFSSNTRHSYLYFTSP